MARRQAVIDQVAGIMTREGLYYGTNNDGDAYRLLFESAAIYVNFPGAPEDPVVKLHSPLVLDVPLDGQRDAILARLNDINSRYRYLKVYLQDDVIIAHYAIPGRNLDGDDFIRAMRMMSSLCETLDDSLMIEFGGNRSSDVLEESDMDEEDD